MAGISHPLRVQAWRTSGRNLTQLHFRAAGAPVNQRRRLDEQNQQDDERGGNRGAHGPQKPLAFFATMHGVDVDKLVEELNPEINNPIAETYVYQETLADSICRRFFKAGIAEALSVGWLWGTIDLLEIALLGGAHHRACQPAFCPWGLWSREPQARPPNPDLLAHQH